MYNPILFYLFLNLQTCVGFFYPFKNSEIFYFYAIFQHLNTTRLVAKGKNKKLALIAVCNNLLKKQTFAIVKSGLSYDEKFVSKLV